MAHLASVSSTSTSFLAADLSLVQPRTLSLDVMIAILKHPSINMMAWPMVSQFFCTVEIPSC